MSDQLVSQAIDCLRDNEKRFCELLNGFPVKIEVIGDYLVIASIELDKPTLSVWKMCDLEKAWVVATENRNRDAGSWTGFRELDPLSNYLWEELSTYSTEE